MKLLVILFLIKLYARKNIVNSFYCCDSFKWNYRALDCIMETY